MQADQTKVTHKKNKFCLLNILSVLAAGMLGWGTTIQAQESAEKPTEKLWIERVQLGGDVRYRQEYSKEEQSSGDDLSRHRSRIRARLSVTGKVSEQLQAKIRLTTAEDQSTGSGNQTLTDNANKKPIDLDMAFISWTPRADVQTLLGKYDVPFETVKYSQLIFDNDLTLEGATLKGQWSQETLSLVANVGSYWIEERVKSSTSNYNEDSGMLGAQLGGQYKNDDFALGLYLADYKFTNIRGRPLIDGGTSAKGNSVTTSGGTTTYDNEYNILSASLILDLKNLSVPISLSLDFAQNSELDHDNTAVLYGLVVGEAKKASDVQLYYNYRSVDKDAVWAAFHDSDFSGGNTDTQGHLAGVRYIPVDNTEINLTYFSSVLERNSNDRSYERAHLDVALKF